MHQTGQKTFYKNCRRGLSTLQLKPKIKQPYCGGKIHPATTARAVQVPSQQPTGHAVKRKRQDDETEYQYRKRLLANTQDNNEDDIDGDPNIETAISIKNSLHNIMRMTKQQLQQNISYSQETVDVLRQHTVFKNKTIEDLRICLINSCV